MNSLYKILNLIISLTIAFSFIACNGDGQDQTNDDFSNMDEGFVQGDESQTYYLIPSPEGIK